LNVLGSELPLNVDIRAIHVDYINPERYPRFFLALQESDVSPRPRAVKPGDEDDVFHLLDPQSKPSGEREPAVDVLDYPLAEGPTCDGVLAFSLYGKEQGRAALPPSAQIRDPRKISRPWKVQKVNNETSTKKVPHPRCGMELRWRAADSGRKVMIGLDHANVDVFG
jgi:hypothetical protein